MGPEVNFLKKKNLQHLKSIEIHFQILDALGDSLCLSSVHVLSDSSQYQIILERIALLYPTVLFLLSSSSMIEGHRLEVKRLKLSLRKENVLSFFFSLLKASFSD